MSGSSYPHVADATSVKMKELRKYVFDKFLPRDSDHLEEEEIAVKREEIQNNARMKIAYAYVAGPEERKGTLQTEIQPARPEPIPLQQREEPDGAEYDDTEDSDDEEEREPLSALRFCSTVDVIGVDGTEWEQRAETSLMAVDDGRDTQSPRIEVESKRSESIGLEVQREEPEGADDVEMERKRPQSKDQSARLQTIIHPQALEGDGPIKLQQQRLGQRKDTELRPVERRGGAAEGPDSVSSPVVEDNLDEVVDECLQMAKEIMDSLRGGYQIQLRYTTKVPRPKTQEEEEGKPLEQEQGKGGSVGGDVSSLGKAQPTSDLLKTLSVARIDLGRVAEDLKELGLLLGKQYNLSLPADMRKFQEMAKNLVPKINDACLSLTRKRETLEQ